MADNPDDLLGYADIVTLTEQRGTPIKRNSLRALRATHRMPEPDDLTFPDRPRWRRATITTWLDNRPGKGTRTDLRPKSADSGVTDA
ncbi:MarR family transcriptional regulator [Frankia tisae]|uniref:MarR family transcriptional regulator n=1 Tax=Frankia tisae TaxID=2950104 RepID=UPI0021C12537|nr:MarR family transcriptional regulator [Frankia tisae]